MNKKLKSTKKNTKKKEPNMRVNMAKLLKIRKEKSRLLREKQKNQKEKKTKNKKRLQYM